MNAGIVMSTLENRLIPGWNACRIADNITLFSKRNETAGPDLRVRLFTKFNIFIFQIKKTFLWMQ